MWRMVAFVPAPSRRHDFRNEYPAFSGCPSFAQQIVHHFLSVPEVCLFEADERIGKIEDAERPGYVEALVKGCECSLPLVDQNEIRVQ